MRRSLLIAVPVVASLVGYSVGRLGAPAPAMEGPSQEALADAEPALSLPKSLDDTGSVLAQAQVPTEEEAPAHDSRRLPMKVPGAFKRALRKSGGKSVRKSTVAEKRARGKAGKDDLSSFKQLRQDLKGNSKPDVFVRKALVALEAGRKQRARWFIKSALKESKEHALAHLVLGLMAQLDGKTAVARTEYSRYLFGAPTGAYAADIRFILSSHDSKVTVAAR